jgi:hypothetical protein
VGERRRPGKGDRRACGRERDARHVRGQRPREADEGLGDDGDGRELQAVNPTGRRDVDRGADEAEDDEHDRRRQRESDPRDDAAEHPGAPRADRDSQLAARRPGRD